MASACEYRLDFPVSLPALDVPRLLRQYGLRPEKSLGQNFLLDEQALERVVDAAQISAQDVVLEIGSGLGSLTRHLALCAYKVIAIELDADLIPPLQTVVREFQNVQVIQG